MTIILGLDPSKSTGWSLMPLGRKYSSIECGVLELPEKSDEYYTADQVGIKLASLIRDCKARHGEAPSFAVLEGQMKAQASNANRGQSFSGSIYPWIATAALVTTLSAFSIPYGTLMPATWRKMFFGQGFKPPLKKDGKKDWKEAAIQQCQEMNITLPRTKALADDAAEACALAICWHSRDMVLHAGRYREPYMRLLQSRNEKKSGEA